MDATPQPVSDTSSQTVLRFCEKALHEYHPRNFAIELWDGSRLQPEIGQSCNFSWKINTPEMLKKLVASPDELSLGEAYISGECEVDGNIESIFPVLIYS